MISLRPTAARGTAAMSAQPAAATPPPRNMSSSRGNDASPPAWKATKVAPIAPSAIWPSAPIFHTFMRSATVTARPVSNSGVARTSVCSKPSVVPNDESHIAR